MDYHRSSMTTVCNASCGWISSSTLAPSLNGYAMDPSITKPVDINHIIFMTSIDILIWKNFFFQQLTGINASRFDL